MKLEESIGLDNRCWYRVGGIARWFTRPRSLEELQEAVEYAAAEGLPRFLLGNGSNVLFSDDGFDGLVICTTLLKRCEFKEAGLIEVQAGYQLSSLVQEANALGWQGLESLPGIPGTIGGATWGNAGAAGESIGATVAEVLLLDGSGGREWIDGRDLPWTYRYSGIGDRVVAAVRLQLNCGSDRQQLEDHTATLMQRKERTQPMAERSCGCIFRNPVGMGEGTSAGEWIERSGMKGMSVGGALVSSEHSNFIVNEGNACAGDIEELIHRIRDRVRTLFDVELQREVILPGPNGGSRE